MSSGNNITKDYFYAENYYDYAVHFRSLNNNTGITTTHFHWNSLTRLVLVILLRIGFVLVQIGSIPVNNVNLILLQNVVEFCCVTIIYFLTGFVIAYNGDVAGLIGEGYWIGDPTIDKNEAIVGWQAVVIASAICTTAVVGRMHTVGYLLVNIFLAGLIQPLLIHWAWTTNGWMAKSELGGKNVAFKDYTGAGVVHIVGGFSGLIGCSILGRRILRLRDLDDASVNNSSAGTVFGGLFLVFVGLQSLCINSYERDKFRGMFGQNSSHAYVNNLLAASSCTLLVVALHFVFSTEAFNHWTVMRCVQGTIAGVVTISAATNDYSPQMAIGLGFMGGIIFYLISKQIFHSALEDYCNVIAIHLGCAIFGNILAPLCAMRTNEDTATMLLNFSWQLICLVALLTLVGTTMLLIFSMLECCGILRNRSECLNHVRANMVVDKSPPRSFLQRIFFPDNGCLYLQPGSFCGIRHRPSIGSRFWKYQAEIDKLEEERPGVKNKSNETITVEDNVTKTDKPEARVIKAKHVHTLFGRPPVLIDRGGTGESINNNFFEIGRKSFIRKEIKYILDPIEEIDEQNSKESNIEENSAQYNTERDKNLPLKENFNISADIDDIKESNYQLRKTVKLMNLHHEIIKEGLEIDTETCEFFV